MQADEFPIDPDVVLLNHASFGVPTTRMMAIAEQTRRRVERDAAGLLAGSLVTELQTQLAAAAEFLHVPTESLALTLNATEGSSAVAVSLGRREGLRVAMLAGEYPSVIRAWQLATEPSSGSVQLVRLELPVASPADVVGEFERQVDGPVDVVVASLVTSSTALVLPVRRLAQWAAERGALTVVDAAHGPGHLELHVADLGAAVVYGTLHKWLPVPRPLGFLYATEELRDVVRPAAVAMYWDDGFLERFAWRGTWDPAPALCLSDALTEWRAWEASGSLARANAMAALLSRRLVECGLSPTGADDALVPPRLRAFCVPGSTPDRLLAALDRGRIRAVVGESPAGDTLLRVATHVYTTADDVQRSVDAVAGVVRVP